MTQLGSRPPISGLSGNVTPSGKRAFNCFSRSASKSVENISAATSRKVLASRGASAACVANESCTIAKDVTPAFAQRSTVCTRMLASNECTKLGGNPFACPLRDSVSFGIRAWRTRTNFPILVRISSVLVFATFW